MTVFVVKCAGCKTLYDSANLRCPECGCDRIINRIWWSREDYQRAEKVGE